MVKVRTEKGWKTMRTIPGDPVFICARRRHIQSARAERAKKVWPTFPPIHPHFEGDILYRLARMSDLDDIVSIVDRLLAGKDFFCPRGQHIGYFKYKTILLAHASDNLIGWAVRQKNGALIHLLIDPVYRGQGIGSHMLEVLEPLLIRSKSDQSTGDPLKFYEKHGYTKTTDERIGKNKNIDLLSKSTEQAHAVK